VEFSVLSSAYFPFSGCNEYSFIREAGKSYVVSKQRWPILAGIGNWPLELAEGYPAGRSAVLLLLLLGLFFPFFFFPLK